MSEQENQYRMITTITYRGALQARRRLGVETFIMACCTMAGAGGATGTDAGDMALTMIAIAASFCTGFSFRAWARQNNWVNRLRRERDEN